MDLSGFLTKLGAAETVLRLGPLATFVVTAPEAFTVSDCTMSMSDSVGLIVRKSESSPGFATGFIVDSERAYDLVFILSLVSAMSGKSAKCRTLHTLQLCSPSPFKVLEFGQLTGSAA